MAEEETLAKAASGSSGGGSNKLVMITSLVNLVATFGIVAVLLISFQKDKAQPTVEDIVAGQASGGHGEAKAGGHGEAAGDAGQPEILDSGKIIPLEPFTVNLSSGIGTFPRYVRMNVSVELDQGVPDKEFDIKLPRVRDTIISLLNAKKASEISAVDGRERLKEEIRKSVNGFMLQSKVKAIYFTNFAVSNP